MIFGLFKKKPATKQKDLIGFLDEADEVLIRCYENKNINLFNNYADSKFMFYLSEHVLENKKLFGIKAYRVREWEVKEKSENIIRVVKRLTHQHVRLSKEISMSIGDDITETWWVDVSEKPIVLKIREGIQS